MNCIMLNDNPSICWVPIVTVVCDDIDTSILEGLIIVYFIHFNGTS